VPSILSALWIREGSGLLIVCTLVVFKATVFVSVIDMSSPLLARFAPTLVIGSNLGRIFGLLSLRFRVFLVVGGPLFDAFVIPFIARILILGITEMKFVPIPS
jgi:hypothetical protein